MKKYLGLTLVLLLVIGMLSACASSGKTGTSTTGAKSETSGDNGKKDESSGGSKETSSFVPKNPQIIVPFSAGGGSDTNARMIVNVIKKNNIMKQNILVVNKPGGSGAIGANYVYNQKGNGNMLMTYVSGQILGAVVNNTKVQLDDLTPVGTVAIDTFLLLVKADSPYKTFKDLVKASKAHPNKVTLGGTGKGSEDYLVYYLMNKNTGSKIKYVSFTGGGDTMTNLLGGSVDCILANPNEVLGQLQAGKLRAIATASTKRLSGSLSDVPTFKELGYPKVHFSQFRGYVGPPNMSAEAVQYWSNILKQVTGTKMWKQEYIKKYNLQPAYKNAEESNQFFHQKLKQYKDILKQTGILK